MIVKKRIGNGVFYIEEWHMCLECKRMFKLNDGYDLVESRGYYGYAHKKCPPLKQLLVNP